MNNYQIPYNGNLEWIHSNTIFFTRHGSKAFGTNIETSDDDFKGVCIPPKNYFFGFDKFEQVESFKPDIVIYDIRKFFKLAADCNPSIIEVLFTDESDHMIVTPLGRELLDNKNMFLSKKVKFTYSGYAISQLQRVKKHHHWHTHPMVEPPSRSDFGLPEKYIIKKNELEAAESAVQKQLDKWNTTFLDELENGMRTELLNKFHNILTDMKLHDDAQYAAAARKVGYDESFIHMLQLERQYKGKMNEWDQYQEWKKNRNPARAELEKKYGYDCKNAYHIVRLVRMCREILTTGNVIVKRPDREELIAIRNGLWTYQQLIEWVEKEDKELEELYYSSAILPKSTDKIKIDELCIKMVENYIL